MSPKKLLQTNILLVDDEPDGLRGLAETLEGLQQNLVQARSGEEALRYTLKLDFAVIVVDVGMPAMDGIETASLIRQRRRSQRTPVIFLASSREEIEPMFHRFAFGTVDYVMKPFAPERLRSKVSIFVDRCDTSAAPELQNAVHYYKVGVARDIAELIPGYMSNRQKELEALRGALATGDFKQLRHLGHRMQGVGTVYGFSNITSLGEEIANSAGRADSARLAALIGNYREYLAKVQVVYE